MRTATFPLVIRVATTCPLQRQSQLITFKLDAHQRGPTPSLAYYPPTAAATSVFPSCRATIIGGLPRQNEVTCCFRAGRDRATRLLVGSTMAPRARYHRPCALLIVRAGGRARRGTRQADGSPPFPSPTSGSPNVTPFLGNPELKAQLDVQGKLAVAGERMHDQLLRRFYTAHGYQTVWDQLIRQRRATCGMQFCSSLESRVSTRALFHNFP